MFSKLAVVATTVALVIAPALAACPNACSGHGRCSNHPQMFSTASETTPYIQMPPTYAPTYGYDSSTYKKDSCTCFTREDDGLTVYAWQGADCSEKTCQYHQSWDSAPHANDKHTVMAECSNRGTCDRKTGECKCYPGYTGSGCQRTTCPNSCSNHGTCKSIKEIAKLMSENTAWSTVSGMQYTLIEYDSTWDSDRIMGCMCDAGFRGPDCSVRECPSGTDPLGGPGSESGRPCSGRGRCDTETGTCTCYTGFFGTKCENQRANVA